MSEQEPTNAHLLAASAAIALESRRLIERTDRTSFQDVGDTLDALHEHLAVAGGSLLFLARRLGCEAEVERMVKEGQQRVDAFRACRGLGGCA